MRKAIKRPSNQHGFTLIELMVVLIVIAILTAVAYPSYLRYAVRGHQADAQEFMLDVASRANQYRLDQRDYPTGLGTGATQLDMTAPEGVADYYSISLNASAGPPPSLTITATPKAGTIQADAATMKLTSAGKKTPPEVWK